MLTNLLVPYDLKCESASRRFQLEEGPSRGLLCDCEIFGNLRITFVWSSRERCTARLRSLFTPRRDITKCIGNSVFILSIYIIYSFGWYWSVSSLQTLIQLPSSVIITIPWSENNSCLNPSWINKRTVPNTKVSNISSCSLCFSDTHNWSVNSSHVKG